MGVKYKTLISKGKLLEFLSRLLQSSCWGVAQSRVGVLRGFFFLVGFFFLFYFPPQKQK